MEKDIDLFQKFFALQDQRKAYVIPTQLVIKLEYLEYAIRLQFEKQAKKQKFKSKKNQIQQQFLKAVEELNRAEKVKHYEKFVRFIRIVVKGEPQLVVQKTTLLNSEGFTRSIHLKRWKKKQLRLDRQRHILYAQRQKKIKHYNLGDYLLRQSKNKDYHCFVLEAINNSPIDESTTVHIGFLDANLYLEWMKAINISVDFKLYVNIAKLLGKNSTQMISSEVKPISIREAQQKNGYSSKRHPREQIKIQETLLAKNAKIEISQSSDGQQQTQGKIFTGSKIFKPGEIKAHEDEAIGETIIDQLLQSDNQAQIQHIQQQQRRVSTLNIKNSLNIKKNLDLFHKILPDYQLEDLLNEDNFDIKVKQSGFKVMQNREHHKRLKIFIHFKKKIPIEAVFSSITNIDFYKKINNQVDQQSIKTMISSENSAIIYQLNKSFNKLYRPRDFVFIRHAFKSQGNYYMVDKSIESSSVPPFITIIRADLNIVWGFFKNADQIPYIVIDWQQTNQGYLNDLQQYNLTLKFLEPLKDIEQIIQSQIDYLLKSKLFDLEWDIEKNEKNIVNNQVRIRRKTQRLEIKKIQMKEQEKQNKIEQTQNKGNFKKKTTQTKPIQNKQEHSPRKQHHHEIMKVQDMQTRGQINPKEAKAIKVQIQEAIHRVQRHFDSQGFVIIDQTFRTHKYQLKPKANLPFDYQQMIVDHPIWKGQWTHDVKIGGIIFINEQIINAQKGVLKFVLTKIGKNLLSGKSILNISLPVDIFSAQSNLQRFMISFCYAPIILEPALKKSPIQRFKDIIIYALSNSPLYLNMAKPFNPILGQTFQCHINGCQGYAQQISHHPPIAALYFVGRGYRISAQLQSKVQLHMNSGCGINDGIFKITFDDGLQGCFITPGGQVGGLTYGDRKFNIVGRGYYWIQKEKLFCELICNPTKKGFFSMGKQQQPSDYLQGNIFLVKSEFFKSFLEKRRSPTEKEILKDLGKISGIWHKKMYFKEQCIFDLDKSYPLKLQYEKYPLPSDANWREDIAYRRILQITRAQTEKQRLEVFQRGDRKLREQFNKKH